MLLIKHSHETWVVFYWDRPFLVSWVFSCSFGEKPFSVGLVDQLFQSVSNPIETVEKASAKTIPRSYRVATENV